VFWTDHQTRGRGRQQREWHDEPGADLAVTFRFTAILPSPLGLPAATPVAVAEACEGFAGRPLRIKWPNDVFLDGRKLAGVLIDAGVGSPTTYLIGVGINCNRVRFPPDLEPIATSLALSTGQVVDRYALLVELAVQIDRMLTDLQNANTTHLERVFRHRLGLFGRPVEVVANTTVRGVLTALDFAQLELDHDTVLPLGVVRSIRAAGA
jgi:BirA family biotin operon repressor/biotin-[acetyl-CoA-carboxylase] ligase